TRVRLDDAARNGKAKPGALPRAGGTGALTAETHVEEARERVGGYAAATVGHPHPRHALLDVTAYLDRAAGRGLPDRVDDQIVQGTPELACIHKDRRPPRRGPVQPHSLRPRQRLRAGQRLGDQVLEADGTAVKL